MNKIKINQELYNKNLILANKAIIRRSVQYITRANNKSMHDKLHQESSNTYRMFVYKSITSKSK